MRDQILARVLGRWGQGGSLVNSIAQWVSQAIILGELKPGDDLNSVELSRRFQTSRTPVREALLLLEKEGLVEIRPRLRPRVARLTIEEVREIYQVRASLYELVAQLITAGATGEVIASLDPHLAQMEEAAAAGSVEGYFWANVAFRDAETAICGNGHVRRMLDSLMLRTLQLRRLSLSLPNRIERSLTDHRRLLQAYRERDAQLACALKRAIVLGGLAAIEASGWAGGRDWGGDAR